MTNVTDRSDPNHGLIAVNFELGLAIGPDTLHRSVDIGEHFRNGLKEMSRDEVSDLALFVERTCQGRIGNDGDAAVGRHFPDLLS